MLRIHLRDPGSRILASVAIAALVALLAAGCGSSGSATGAGKPSASKSAGSTSAWPKEGNFKLASRIANDVKSGKKLIIDVAYHDPSLPFATPLRTGVANAARQLGVNATLIGPASGAPSDQVSQLQTLITQGQVDGIAVSSASNNALQPVIAQAYDAGIPIISFNTDNPGSKEMAFVGQNLPASGQQEGKELLKTLHGKKGKVVVFSQDTGAGWSHDRFQGFTSAVNGSGLQIVSPVNTGAEPNQEYNAVQNTMTGNSNAIAIASMDCCSFDAAAQWVQLSHNTGKIPVIGFDFEAATARYMKDGVIPVTLDQNPVLQGYDAVKVLADYLKDHQPIKSVNTGIKPITKANMTGIPTEG